MPADVATSRRSRWTLGSLFGPIPGKELRGLSRRRRLYVARLLFLLALGGVLVLAWQSIVTPANQMSANAMLVYELPDAGRALAITIAWCQFGALQLAGLLLGVGAIREEIDRGSMPLLLCTPVTPGQILRGKLASILASLAVVVLITLPLLALLRVFGGLSWRFVIDSSVTSLFYAALTASCAMLMSILYRYTAAAVLMTVAVIYAVLPLAGGILTFVLFHIFEVLQAMQAPAVMGLVEKYAGDLLFGSFPIYGMTRLTQGAIPGAGVGWPATWLYWVEVLLVCWVLLHLAGKRLGDAGRWLGVGRVQPNIYNAMTCDEKLAITRSLQTNAGSKPPLPSRSHSPGASAVIAPRKAPAVPPVQPTVPPLPPPPPPVEADAGSVLAQVVQSRQASRSKRILRRVTRTIKQPPGVWLAKRLTLGSSVLLTTMFLVIPVSLLGFTLFLAMLSLTREKSFRGLSRMIVAAGFILLYALPAGCGILSACAGAALRRTRMFETMMTLPIRPCMLAGQLAWGILRCGRIQWAMLLLISLAGIAVTGKLATALLTPAIIGSACLAVTGAGLLIGSVIGRSLLAVLVTVGAILLVWVALPNMVDWPEYWLTHPFVQLDAVLSDEAPPSLRKMALTRGMPVPDSGPNQFFWHDRARPWGQTLLIVGATSAGYALLGSGMFLLAGRALRKAVQHA